MSHHADTRATCWLGLRIRRIRIAGFKVCQQQPLELGPLDRLDEIGVKTGFDRVGPIARAAQARNGNQPRRIGAPGRSRQ